MSEIEDLGVTVEEYLEGLAAGVDVLELKRLTLKGIPTFLGFGSDGDWGKGLQWHSYPCYRLSED